MPNLGVWGRCTDRDREIIERLQGAVEPVHAEEVLRQVRRHLMERGPVTALIDGARRWTYRDLGERVFGICAALQEAFPLPGGRDPAVFGVAMERSADLVATVQAIFLTGNAYCPLNPAEPRAWTEGIAERSGATAVVVPHDGPRPVFGKQFELPAEGAAVTPVRPVAVGPDTPSQVIFTSGSTGRPKGVVCTHGGFANRIRWMQQMFPLTGTDRVALKTPFTFDVAGWELFWPQYAGAATVVVTPGAHTSPETLISLFTAHEVTVTHFVPSMLRLFLRAEGARRCPSLRMVFCSGEPLPADLVEEFGRQSTARLHNLYGPTEASIDVTHFPADGPARHPVPIGRPITNTHLYILDEDRRICPVGEPGEIYIHGLGVAAGYRGVGKEDADRFSPPPLPVQGLGWRTFRTGDFGKYTNDGQIEFLGRRDGQVKIRGQRVELAETEHVLRTYGAVREACALVRKTAAGRGGLVAYVVLDPEHALPDPVGDLMNHLMCRLPSRSVPARILLVDELPLTAHGKVDRGRLPTPAQGRPDLATEFEAPSTRLELLIASIWAQVMDLDEVGTRDDFHLLGGDSLAAVEISFLIAERLGLDYDHDLVSEILLGGDTVEHSARIARAGGVPDATV
ncbi:amino acid adenylation domain-containing protein [Streptomyces sp. NPDC048254]|uniref:non-ribosomal peptide synthetase n=1 Tax=Streptomyces sp. NPDC048254 TaxID=3365525 RepID=UPI003718BC85